MKIRTTAWSTTLPGTAPAIELVIRRYVARVRGGRSN